MFLARAIAASRRRIDPDAADYFARIVAAGSTISEPNKAAVNAFVTGCKADGIWSAIKASCLLAGPDTLAGALVPLVGPAPTNFNFVTGDYNRVTGLVGDGSTKYLNSNRNNNADGRDNQHAATWVNTAQASGTGAVYLGIGFGSGSLNIGRNTLGTDIFTRSRSATLVLFEGKGAETGTVAVSRDSSSAYGVRAGGDTAIATRASDVPSSGSILVFARDAPNGSSPFLTNARLSYYSIGESLDLALLDARLTTYMASIS